MPVTYQDTPRDPRRYVSLPELTFQGKVLTLKPGVFLCDGVPYHLEEEQVYTIPEHTPALDLGGFLVEDKDKKTVGLLVDEILNDGVDKPYSFRAVDCPYRCLFRLFVVELDSKVLDFSKASRILVYRTTVPEAPKEDPRG